MGVVYAFGADFMGFVHCAYEIQPTHKSVSPENLNTPIMKKNATIYKQNFCNFTK